MSKQQVKWPVVVVIVGVVAAYLYGHQLLPKKSAPVTVGPGTPIEVRLEKSVSSRSSVAGERLSGKLNKDIVADGKVIVPEGTEVSGKVIEASPVGHLAGGASLKVTLTSFSIEGTDYPVQTTTIVRISQGQGMRTAKLAGGGAVLGAAIGALAHGKKGALIGAAAGAGAGAVGSAATNSAHDVVMPAQSVLTFKLTESVVVGPKEKTDQPHDLLATIRGLFS